MIISPFHRIDRMNHPVYYFYSVDTQIQVLSIKTGTIFGESAMIQNYIENANFEDTGFAYTLSLISGKHKMVILYCLMEFQTVRFNELKRYLKTISDKTLSTNLKELEGDGLIIRTEYPQIPPKVEYSLSERGKSLMTVLDQLCVWGEKNRVTG